jgi:probable rRNA maturation factor
MIEVEVFGRGLAPEAPPLAEVRLLCYLAAGSMGVRDGHVAIEFVDAERIAELNARHRSRPGPTDVLSFPIDGAEAAALASRPEGEQPGARSASQAVPRELGDVLICPEHTVDLREAIVHGMLHLLGMDHESDGGEMLALQDELLERADR